MRSTVRIVCRSATMLTLIGLATLILGGLEARASELRVLVRIRQEFYTPLVPVTHNFRPCFEMDDQGRQVMKLCNDVALPSAPVPAASPARVPAQKSQVPQAVPAPKRLPLK